MSERPAANVPNNNAIPTAATWVFALLMLGALLALPFLVFKVMALTQNRAQGMSLADTASLPIPAADMRCTVRETRDKGRLAARYELTPDQSQAIGAKLTPGRPDAAFFDVIKQLSPGETVWLPASDSAGPWRTASGRSRGYDWTAALDESTRTLWIHAVRLDSAQ